MTATLPATIKYTTGKALTCTQASASCPGVMPFRLASSVAFSTKARLTAKLSPMKRGWRVALPSDGLHSKTPGSCLLPVSLQPRPQNTLARCQYEEMWQPPLPRLRTTEDLHAGCTCTNLAAPSALGDMKVHHPSTKTVLEWAYSRWSTEEMAPVRKPLPSGLRGQYVHHILGCKEWMQKASNSNWSINGANL